MYGRSAWYPLITTTTAVRTRNGDPPKVPAALEDRIGESDFRALRGTMCWLSSSARPLDESSEVRRSVSHRDSFGCSGRFGPRRSGLIHSPLPGVDMSIGVGPQGCPHLLGGLDSGPGTIFVGEVGDGVHK
jgi:hypothetical protein